MKKNLLVAALLSVTATGAMAQSAFEGFYGQVGVGYESINVEGKGATLRVANTNYTFSQSFDQSNNFNGTVTAGYNFGINKDFLLGIGAEYSPFSSSNSNYSLSNSALGTIRSTYNKQNAYNFFVSPTFVIDKDKAAYFKIGYTGASAKDNADGSTANYTGYSLGLGYKQIISGGIYAFGETNYYKYGDKTLTESGTLSGTSYTSTVSSGINAMNVMVGIGYKF